MIRSRRWSRLAGAAAVAALLTAACGDDDEDTASDTDTTEGTADGASGSASTADEPQELRSVLVRAGFYFTANTEAIFIAQEEGYFAEEGLDVAIREGNGSGAVIQLIGAGGDAEIGWAIDSGTAALNISKGVPVKIAQINKRTSPFGTSCHEGIEFDEPSDLVDGPSVLVVPGESTAAIFPAYLATNGIDEDDVNIVNSDAPTKVQLFASGQADCMIGYVAGDNLQASIANPDIPPAVPWSEHGVALLGDGIVVADSLAEEEPEVVAAFLRAVNRGYADMCADIEGSAERFIDRFPEYTDADAEFVRRSMPLECEAVRPSDGRPPFAPVSDEEWDGMIELLAEYGGLEEVLPREDYLVEGLDVGEVDW